MKKFFLSFVILFSLKAFAQQDPLTIKDNNVGIGTAIPSEKLTVNGNIYLNGGTSGNGNGVIGPKLILDNSYNTSGINKIVLYDDGKAWAGGFGIKDQTLALHSGGDFKFFTGAGHNTDGNTRLTILSNGNVGIGITNPVNKLEVNGAIHTNGYPIYFRESTDQQADYVKWNKTDDRLELAGWHGVNIGSTSTGKNSIMTVTDSGNVGIGNTTPYAALDVTGNIFTSVRGSSNEHAVENRGTRRIGMQSGSDVNDGFAGLELTTEAFNCGNGGLIKFITWGCDADSSREVMRINEIGKVGIATKDPGYPLEVGGYSSYSGINPWFEENGGQFGGLGSGTGAKPISIYAETGILTGIGYYLTSDKRIKKSIATTDTHKDLLLLNRLHVTNFQYKNALVCGNAFTKGFIAQDVEKLFPQAVNTGSDFIPDIYAPSLKSSLSNNVLTVRMKDNHKLTTGDVVRIITKNNETKDVTVKVVNNKEFTVNNWTGTADALFVYGKKVNDFRSLDYQQIFALGISATQELSKQVDALKCDNERLQKENQATHQTLAAMQARMEGLEKKLSALIITAGVSKEQAHENK